MVCVPVQGFATVLGDCCVRGQMRESVATAVYVDSSTANDTPCTEHGAGPASKSLKHEKLRKLCHCASCGLGAVAPPPGGHQALSEFSHTDAKVEVSSPVMNFIPFGLDRPPKYPA